MAGVMGELKTLRTPLSIQPQAKTINLLAGVQYTQAALLTCKLASSASLAAASIVKRLTLLRRSIRSCDAVSSFRSSSIELSAWSSSSTRATKEKQQVHNRKVKQ